MESTPIFDILSGNKCEDYNTSNILGYYYGYDKGYICGYYGYKTQRYEKCGGCQISTKVNPHGEIEYKYFKGKRLCTSKRPNKNYFDYLKFTVRIKEKCKEGTKNVVN